MKFVLISKYYPDTLIKAPDAVRYLECLAVTGQLKVGNSYIVRGFFGPTTIILKSLSETEAHFYAEIEKEEFEDAPDDED